MIRAYQKRFVRLMMLAVTLALFIILVLVNCTNYMQLRVRSLDRLDRIIANEGKIPKPDDQNKKPPTEFELSYFIVEVNDEEITPINISHSYATSNEQAIEFTNKVLEDKKETAIYKGYRYKIIEKEDVTWVIFVNVRHQIESCNVFFFTSLGITIMAIMILYIIILIASKYAILPMEEGIEKQKRFIMDAGHEIKTPLAIISANNEVLEMELGDNEWIKSNKNQIVRLNELIKKLLLLTKMEESEYEFITIHLSECLERTIIAFKPLIDQKEIKLIKNIESDILIEADAPSIQTLINVLLENAIKYIQSPNEMHITCKSNYKGCIIEVFNTCEKIDDIELLFERFYRGDKSRSSTIGGQGIGLSIAKAIVDAHHGQISAQYVHNGMLFKVEL